MFHTFITINVKVLIKPIMRYQKELLCRVRSENYNMTDVPRSGSPVMKKVDRIITKVKQDAT